MSIWDFPAMTNSRKGKDERRFAIEGITEQPDVSPIAPNVSPITPNVSFRRYSPLIFGVNIFDVKKIKKGLQIK